VLRYFRSRAYLLGEGSTDVQIDRKASHNVWRARDRIAKLVQVDPSGIRTLSRWVSVFIAGLESSVPPNLYSIRLDYHTTFIAHYEISFPKKLNHQQAALATLKLEL